MKSKILKVSLCLTLLLAVFNLTVLGQSAKTMTLTIHNHRTDGNMNVYDSVSGEKLKPVNGKTNVYDMGTLAQWKIHNEKIPDNMCLLTWSAMNAGDHPYSFATSNNDSGYCTVNVHDGQGSKKNPPNNIVYPQHSYGNITLDLYPHKKK